MSGGVNKVLLLGNLGADGELRVTTGGQSVLKLRVACNESYLDRNNVRQERTEWVRVTIWGRRAEALAKILQKGDAIFVEGRLQTSKYEKDNETRYSTEVVANNIVLPGNRNRGGQQQSRTQAPGGDAFNAGEDEAPQPAANPDDDAIPF